MSNFLEVDTKILENNLLIKNDLSDADNLENFFRSPENYLKDNTSWRHVTPTAGFCVKTTDSKNKKVFINLCKLDDIPEPRDITEAELMEIWQSDDVPDFRIPLSIQEPHDEFDKSGNPTVAYDVALNTKFFQKVQSNVVFRSFVLQVVLEGLENKYDVELKKEGYVILQNRKCLGELRPHRIRKCKLTGAQSKPLIEELHSTSTVLGSGDVPEVMKKSPEYRFFEDTRNNFAVGQFYLPHLVTPNDIKLDVNKNRLVLEHQRNYYFADFFLPMVVDETKTTASFNLNTNIMTVKMPIISKMMKIVSDVNPLRLVYLTGIFSLSCFVILAFCWQILFDFILKTQIQLNPDSTLYKIWVKNSIPLYLEIYLFNFTNANEFEKDKSVVPIFEEVGPFIFEEIREKVNISWDSAQETVTFNQTREWRLLPEMSRDMLVKVTNINPVAATIAYISRLWKSNLQRQIANALLIAHEPLIVEASAQEWIFDGIPDKFLEMFKILRKVSEIPIPYDRFAWFYERNKSSSFDGTFTIKTGKRSISDLGMMVAWNHQSKTNHYVDECASVRGSTGEIIPPLKPFQQSLTVFASDICSYVAINYAGSVDFRGLDAYEYVGDESVFDNGTSYPGNLCFYVGESCPSGSRNVSSCRFGSPAFISFPHFYLADSYYTENLKGMNPDEKKHKFSLKVEPKTGIPLAVNAGFQINFLLKPYKWCDEFREVPEMFVPMLWFRQTVEISEDYTNILRVVLFFQNNGKYFVFGYAFFILLCILIFLYLKKVKLGKN